MTDPTRSDTPDDLFWHRQNAGWLATLLDDVEVLRPTQLRVLVLFLAGYDHVVLEEALWVAWGLEGPGPHHGENQCPTGEDCRQEQPEHER